MTKDFISDRVNFAPLNKKTEKNEISINYRGQPKHWIGNR